MSATFKWGLLSTARINRAILNAMPQSERGEMLAVGSRDLEKAKAYAAQNKIPRAYGSYEALLADPDVHIVYNGLPNSLHAEWTIKALEAGKHVLCEKPFATTLADVDAMHAAAHKAGRVVAEAFMYRHHPKVRKAKELLDAGAIGTPRFLRASFTFYMDYNANVRWDPALGGGALWDVGCYPVSFARYMFGAPERVEAFQVTSPTGVDETLIATLYFPNERVAQFDSSFRIPYRTYAEILGDQGAIMLNRPFHSDDKDAVLVLRQGDNEQQIDLANPERYWLEIEDMHDAILAGQPTLITPAETRGHVETILELYAAAKKE